MQVDPLLFGEAAPFASAKAAALALIPYIERELRAARGCIPSPAMCSGLFHGVPGARAFRRHLAIEAVKPGACAQVSGRRALPGGGQAR